VGLWWTGGGSQAQINQEDFTIEVTNQSVKVRLNASKKSPRGRFYWCIFFGAVWIAVLSLAVFAKGKRGEPSMWHDFATHSVNSRGFIIPLVILLGASALVAFINWRYVVMAHPSDEIFYCDRSALTISKVRWLDIHNTDWRTRSYPLDAIAGDGRKPTWLFYFFEGNGNSGRSGCSHSFPIPSQAERCLLARELFKPAYSCHLAFEKTVVLEYLPMR
jgi:hypothetical protein